MKPEFFGYAISNLRRRGLRSWLTVLGVFIGIIAVVALISLGEGMQTAINKEFETIGKDRLTITAGGAFLDLLEEIYLLQRLQKKMQM